MLGEGLLPRMPRPLSFLFGLYSGSLGALGCVWVFFSLLSFLSLVYKLKSFIGALVLSELVSCCPFWWACCCSLIRWFGGAGREVVIRGIRLCVHSSLFVLSLDFHSVRSTSFWRC